MMSKWEMVRLGDVGTVITGNTPKTSDAKNYDSDDLYFVKPSDIAEGVIVQLNASENYVSEYARKSCRVVPQNSVLVTCIGIIGKIGMTTSEVAFNQQINAIVPDAEKCNHKFLAYAISRVRAELNHVANAAVVPIINKSQFSDIKILLPPLDVQEKIADVLDCASTLIEKRKAQIAKLDLLMKSRFVEMFGDPVVNPMGWKTLTLGECGTLKNGMNFSQNDYGYSVYCLGVGNFGDLYKVEDVFDISKINILSKPSDDYILKNGDIVFVRSNGSKELVGRCVEVFPRENEMTFSGFCIRFRNENSELGNTYLNHALHLPAMRLSLTGSGRGANIQNVNQQMLSSLKISSPPIELQHQFADFVQQTEKSKIQMQQGLDKLEVLYKSLVQKCFNGEVY